MSEKLKTKDRILHSSLHLFAKSGFHGTTFQQIADDVGISQPGIFIHFKNKLDLFAALREQVAQENRDFVDSQITIQDSAFESLHKHCKFNLEWVVKNRDRAQLIILLYHYSCFDEDMRKLNLKALIAGQERLLKYILAGIREQSIVSLNPQQLAEQIHSYIIGQSIKYLALEKPPSSKAIETSVKELLARIAT